MRWDMLTREDLLGDGVAPTGGGRLPSAGIWREGPEHLTAVFDGKSVSDSDQLLAYGLRDLAGRRLRLVLPSAAAEAARHRAAMIDADVEVYVDDGGGLTPTVPATLDDAIDWFGRLGGLADHPDPDDLNRSAEPPWLLDLVDWVESRRVERQRRSQYYSWHYRGRQIMRLEMRSNGDRQVQAGVDYKTPTGGQPDPVTVTVAAGERLLTWQRHALEHAVELAIERRRTGVDSTHREHLLQETLGTEPSVLGMTRLHREYPAWRPGGSSHAFIDFVGVDVDERLHVIETKIGSSDKMLGLQGLDYWAWVTAHHDEIADQLGVQPPDTTVWINYVLGATAGELLHAAAAETIRRIHPDIPWRCHLIDDWDTVARPGQLLRLHADGNLRPRQIPKPVTLKGASGP